MTQYQKNFESAFADELSKIAAPVPELFRGLKKAISPSEVAKNLAAAAKPIAKKQTVTAAEVGANLEGRLAIGAKAKTSKPGWHSPEAVNARLGRADTPAGRPAFRTVADPHLGQRRFTLDDAIANAKKRTGFKKPEVAMAKDTSALNTPKIENFYKSASKKLPWIIGGTTLAAGAATAAVLSPGKDDGAEKVAALNFGKLFKGTVPKGVKIDGTWTHVHPQTRVETTGKFADGFENIPKGAKVKGTWHHEGSKTTGTFDSSNYKPKPNMMKRVGAGVLGAAAVTGLATAAGAASAMSGSPYEVNP